MKEFDQLVNIVKKLRSPEGCPWDRAQKISNVKKHLLEETYELIEGIHKRNVRMIQEELGDVFLLLVFISQLYAEKKQFTIEQALDQINTKLISRHPHVFSSKKLKTKEEVLRHWIKNKAKKKNRKTIRDRLSPIAPALLLLDIFLKDLHHINEAKGSKNKEKQIKSSFLHMKRHINSFYQGRSKEKILVEIITEIGKIAFAYGIDLENALRENVLREAQKVRY